MESKITLSEEQRAEIVLINNAIGQDKINLSNVVIQEEALARQRKSLIRSIERRHQLLNDKLKDLAEAYGLDDESGWLFHLDQMVFETRGESA